MHLTVVRHGETEANITGHWQGHGDSPLNATGRGQAGKLADRLADQRWDLVVSSDLQRARHTAEAVGGRTGNSVRLDAVWRELDLGRWEGLTREQVHSRWPEEVQALRRGENVAIGGAESWQDLAMRIAGGLRTLIRDHSGERVLLAAHGGVVMTLISTLFGVDHARPRPLGRIANTSVTEVLFQGGAPRVLRLNDASHLGEPDGWVRDSRNGRELLVKPANDALHGQITAALAGRGGGGAVLQSGVPGPAVVLQGDGAPTLISWNLARG